MPETTIWSMAREKVGTIDLPEPIFQVHVNPALVHEAVHHYLACRRSGTANTKGRAEMQGGGRKPWRQKGTGRARHGSRRSPLWIGGSTTFGPKPRDFGFRFPKKKRWNALRSSLTDKHNAGQLHVVNTLELKAPKTGSLETLIRDFGIQEYCLLVDVEVERNVELAARNNPRLATQRALGLHPYHVLRYDQLIITTAGVKALEELLSP